MLRVKYAQVPVVAAVSGHGAGRRLRTGAALRASGSPRLESYIGLVEVGVGLIPGGGGLKEGALRAAAAAARRNGNDLLPFLRNWFENAAMAKVSTSALEARAMGYLLPTRHDRVQSRTNCCGPRSVEAFALHARRLSPAAPGDGVPGRRPPAGRPPSSAPAGEHARGRLHQRARLPDRAARIADVLSGGDVEAGIAGRRAVAAGPRAPAFRQSWSATPRSQERMMGMLQTGKPVRN